MAKRTYQPKKRKRAKTHGFLTRAKTSAGRKIVRGRRRAGRTRLAA
ncbi:MAG: 50S ribosomal protein L34 [Candidatus Paceibacterota bacterium]